MSRQICQATTKRGKPCRNPALPGSLYCRRHSCHGGQDPAAAGSSQEAGEQAKGDADASWEQGKRRSLLQGVLGSEEVRELEALTAEPEVDDIMPAIAYALRQAILEGLQPREILRACDSYLKALVARHKMTGQMAHSLEQALAEALDAITHELAAGEEEEADETRMNTDQRG